MENTEASTPPKPSKISQINIKIIRDIVVIFLIGLIVGFVAVHVMYMPTAARLAELEQEYGILTDELINKTASIESLEAEIQSKSVMIDNLTSQVATKQAEITSLQQQLNEIEQQIGTQNTTISELEAQISDLLNTISNKNSQISMLEQTINTLRAQVDNLKLRPIVLGVYFSPQGECTEQVINWISKANSSIHVLSYMLTLDSIGNALVDAYERGVEVKVVFEETRITPLSEYQKLNSTGISVRTDNNPKSMNNRVMIVDGAIILTGSFTWTEDGRDFNDENLIVIQSLSVADIFEQEFQRIWDMSKI